MPKKRSKARQYIRKNIVGVVKFLVPILVAIAIGILARPIININQTFTPPAAQASWHDVQSWQIGVATTATPQTALFDWGAFFSDVSSCLVLGAGVLILLYDWKRSNWKQKYERISVRNRF